MTDPHASRADQHPWDAEFARLRARHPDASDGTLFCVYKLMEDPNLELKDFDAEADLLGIPVHSRSFAAARMLVAVEQRKRAAGLRVEPPAEEAPAQEIALDQPEELDVEYEAAAWPRVERELRAQHPDATTGILFCIHKLRQDPTLRIPDFRHEAAQHGIKLGGRALHTAKTLLGLRAEPRTRPQVRGTGDEEAEPPNGSDIEAMVLQTFAEVQNAAREEAVRLRKAMKEAEGILRRALDGTQT